MINQIKVGDLVCLTEEMNITFRAYGFDLHVGIVLKCDKYRKHHVQWGFKSYSFEHLASFLIVLSN